MHHLARATNLLSQQMMVTNRTTTTAAAPATTVMPTSSTAAAGPLPLPVPIPMPSAFTGSSRRRSNNMIIPKKRRRSALVGRSKTVTKDVVCLISANEEVDVPRGKNRGLLQSRGLVGKITLNSLWTQDEVQNEVTSVFRHTFSIPDDQLLHYTYLQVTYSSI